jgi:hypothetical protein
MKKTTPPKGIPADWKEQLKSFGFSLAEQGGVTVVRRDGCSASIEVSGSEPRFRVKPGLVFGVPPNDTVAHLLDRGFQKFWLAGERGVSEKTWPARAVELKALGDFDRDLRSVLGMTRLYNEAIGMVSSVYYYDRVEGREPGKRHESF